MKAFRQFRAWWTVLELGSAMTIGRSINRVHRFQVLDVLNREGLLEFLREPRTYGEILARFDYVDGDYPRDLLAVLTDDKQHVLEQQDGRYHLSPTHTLSSFDEVMDSTDKRYQGFANLASGMVDNIPRRLRGEPVAFTEGFAMQGRGMLKSFDDLLSLRYYTASRNAAFAFLKLKERAWLRGKTLLDVGCGSGRETAELWLHLGGETRITAVDPVPDMLERAERNFPRLLVEIDPAHPPVTAANRPVFEEASAIKLPYEDNSFDAAFYSYILHWTPDPRRAVSEVVRVVKPDGLIFGVQIARPYWSPFTDLVIRSNENAHGFFWREEHRQWYAENGFECEITTPIGVFRARSTDRF